MEAAAAGSAAAGLAHACRRQRPGAGFVWVGRLQQPLIILGRLMLGRLQQPLMILGRLQQPLQIILGRLQQPLLILGRLQQI